METIELSPAPSAPAFEPDRPARIAARNVHGVIHDLGCILQRSTRAVGAPLPGGGFRTHGMTLNQPINLNLNNPSPIEGEPFQWSVVLGVAEALNNSSNTALADVLPSVPARTSDLLRLLADRVAEREAEEVTDGRTGLQPEDNALLRAVAAHFLVDDTMARAPKAGRVICEKGVWRVMAEGEEVPEPETGNGLVMISFVN